MSASSYPGYLNVQNIKCGDLSTLAKQLGAQYQEETHNIIGLHPSAIRAGVSSAKKISHSFKTCTIIFNENPKGTIPENYTTV